MNIGLIIALVAILLVLTLGYNIMLQYKLKVETTKKQESARYLTIIDATEDYVGRFDFGAVGYGQACACPRQV